MSRRLHTAGLASVLTALTLAAGVALASPDGEDGGEYSQPPRDRTAKMAAALSLDAEQTAALEAMQTQLKADRETSREALKAIRASMDAELAQETPNNRTVHKLIDEKLAIEGELAHDKMDSFLAFRATLSPEQRAEFDARMGERRSHRHKANGREGHGGEHGSSDRER